MLELKILSFKLLNWWNSSKDDTLRWHLLCLNLKFTSFISFFACMFSVFFSLCYFILNRWSNLLTMFLCISALWKWSYFPIFDSISCYLWKFLDSEIDKTGRGPLWSFVRSTLLLILIGFYVSFFNVGFLNKYFLASFYILKTEG